MLRLNKPIPDALLERIRTEFQGLLAPVAISVKARPICMKPTNQAWPTRHDCSFALTANQPASCVNSSISSTVKLIK